VVTTYRGEGTTDRDDVAPQSRRNAALARATGSTGARRTTEAGVMTSELGFAVLMRALRGSRLTGAASIR
jgi:hypothetical protein